MNDRISGSCEEASPPSPSSSTSPVAESSSHIYLIVALVISANALGLIVAVAYFHILRSSTPSRSVVVTAQEDIADEKKHDKSKECGVVKENQARAAQANQLSRAVPLRASAASASNTSQVVPMATVYSRKSGFTKGFAGPNRHDGSVKNTHSANAGAFNLGATTASTVPANQVKGNSGTFGRKGGKLLQATGTRGSQYDDSENLFLQNNSGPLQQVQQPVGVNLFHPVVNMRSPQALFAMEKNSYALKDSMKLWDRLKVNYGEN